MIVGWLSLLSQQIIHARHLCIKVRELKDVKPAAMLKLPELLLFE
jgi:hypothetical protein